MAFTRQQIPRRHAFRKMSEVDLRSNSWKSRVQVGFTALSAMPSEGHLLTQELGGLQSCPQQQQPSSVDYALQGAQLPTVTLQNSALPAIARTSSVAEVWCGDLGGAPPGPLHRSSPVPASLPTGRQWMQKC